MFHLLGDDPLGVRFWTDDLDLIDRFGIVAELTFRAVASRVRALPEPDLKHV